QGFVRLQERVQTIARQEGGRAWKEGVTGPEELGAPWDDTVQLDMAYDHLMHQPAMCPQDGSPVIFTSLPNPRRKARYRVSCFYCGRQAEMDWPPPDLRR